MSPFSLEAHAVRWSGVIHPESKAQVSVNVPDTQAGFAELRQALQDGDALAADTAVRAVPMPLTMLHDLAKHCLATVREAALDVAAGKGAPDPRWAMALSEMAGHQGAHGKPELAPARDLYRPAKGLRVNRLRELGGALAVLADNVVHAEIDPRYELAIGDGKGWQTTDFTTERQVQVALPLPLVAPLDKLWVTTREPSGAVVLDTYSRAGERLSRHEGHAPSAVQHVSVLGKHRWLHCERHHQLFGSALVVEHQDPWKRPLVVGNWLLSFGPRHFDAARREHISSHFTWTSLDRAAKDVSFSWNETVFSAAVMDGFAILGTANGVFTVAPGGQAERLVEGRCFGIATDDAHFAVVVGRTVRLFDAVTRQQIISFSLGSDAYRVTLTKGCIVASDYARAWVFSRTTNALVFDSGERREPAAQPLRNGHTLVSAGEVVAAFDAQGALQGSTSLPYDGQLVGATDTHGIFGPVSGGVPRTQPDGLYAIDSRAQVVSALRFDDPGYAPRPLRTRYGGGTETDGGVILHDRVLVVSSSGALLSWDLATAKAVRVLMEAKRMPMAKGVTETRFHTTNPRDEWPVPGVEVQGATFLAVGCTYRGTTGVSSDVAVRVRNGAVATFVGCTLGGDGGGVEAEQGSSVVLKDCDIGPGAVKLGAGCHLVML